MYCTVNKIKRFIVGIKWAQNMKVMALEEKNSLERTHSWAMLTVDKKVERESQELHKEVLKRRKPYFTVA